MLEAQVSKAMCRLIAHTVIRDQGDEGGESGAQSSYPCRCGPLRLVLEVLRQQSVMKYVTRLQGYARGIIARREHAGSR
jgi:hypothetical protein